MMTNSIDPQQAQRVWSRVMAAGAAPSTSTAPAAQETAEEPTVSFEAQLQELLRRARADAALNIRLARRLRGGARQTLLHLAEQSRQEARTLAALYYLTTGQRASPFRPTRPRALRRVCGGSMSGSLQTPLHTARWRSKPPPTPKRSPALRTVHSAMPARWFVFCRTVCRNAHAPAAVHRGGGNLLELNYAALR